MLITEDFLFMTNLERAQIAVKILKEIYPTASCSLVYRTPIELLISIRLSAQCTDARVNLVTPELFSKFKNLEDFAEAQPEELEKYIYSCGFYKIKSQDIVNMCRIIKKKYGGKIPDNLNDLTSLPGIGRKTANLFLGEIFNRPAIVVDTHFIRITKRLGFHDTENATQIENIMKNLISPPDMLGFCHRIIAHGRKVCTARSPKCNQCYLKNICNYFLNIIDNNF